MGIALLCPIWVSSGRICLRAAEACQLFLCPNRLFSRACFFYIRREGILVDDTDVGTRLGDQNGSRLYMPDLKDFFKGNLDPAQAVELALLLDLEACWEK